ncbi:4Fe-4S binding protein [Neptuniibacter sp. QD34_54]|uniref:4Fe-4S binding protein n=1 Tax=Neptuniibacter sp. QD34_54 TaxID=3398208 RepID=UPI0039F5062C
MTQEKLRKLYPSPFVVGEKDNTIDVWPLFKEEVTGLNQVGYIYESIDFSSIPGFMGVPYNLLAVLDSEGSFVDVRVLFHREPMFVAGIGEQPMFDFVDQYKGLSLMQNIKFSDKQGQKKPNDSKNIYLDGVTGATASIRILNQTLLSSAIKIARAKLGFGGSKDPDLIAKIDHDIFEVKGWSELIDSGLINKILYTNAEAEALFAGTQAEGRDPIALKQPKGNFVELYVMDLAIPTLGRNLLTPESWEFLQENLEAGDHALLVVSNGRYSFMHENTLRAGISDRLLLRQQGLPIEMRDLDFDDRLDLIQPDYKIKLPEPLSQADWMVYRVIDTSGIDISLPLEFDLGITRGQSISYLPSTTKELKFKYSVPDDYFYEPDINGKTWQPIWEDRLGEIIILSLGLVVLFIVLIKQAHVTKHKKFFAYFRICYLLFTLFFIGWYAQGQLSIVNITGAIQALMAGGNLNFFLYDPMTTLLWGCVFITFFIWGRGTFCGWLCPFGALQGLSTKLLTSLNIRQFEPSSQWDKHFKKLKYVVLLLILTCAFTSPIWTDRLVEIEPFKTSITFFFVRSWPFVIWALLLVALSVFVYKGYCRYVCPLGAAMAILGKLRLLNWLPRRDECGSPCQLCKQRCEYRSIEQTGQIDYDECFQCLDCVVIYENDNLCVPLIVEKRQGRKLKTRPHNHKLIATCE